MTEKEVVIKKLKLTERGALNILKDNDLCKRILLENVIELKDACEKYGIMIQKLKYHIRKKHLSTIVNGSELKGRKQYLFESELNDFLDSMSYIDYQPKWDLKLKDQKDILLKLAEKTLNNREFRIYSDVTSMKSVFEIANSLNCTQQNIEQYYRKALSKMYRVIDKFIKYDEYKSEINLLEQKKYNLQKNINALKKNNSELILEKGEIKIKNSELSIRAKRLLINADINTWNDLHTFIEKNGIGYFKKFRNLGASAYNEIEKFYGTNK